MRPGARGVAWAVSWTLRVIEMHPDARVPGAWVVWVVPGRGMGGARGVVWAVSARRDICSGGR